LAVFLLAGRFIFRDLLVLGKRLVVVDQALDSIDVPSAGNLGWFIFVLRD